MNLEISQEFVSKLLLRYALPHLKEYGVRDLSVRLDKGEISLRAVLYLLPITISVRILGYTSRRIHLQVGPPLDLIMRFVRYESDLVKVRYGIITLDFGKLNLPGRIRKIRISRGRLLVGIG